MKSKKLFFIPAAAVLCLLMAGCGSTAVDLNDYLEVEFNGYNSSGTVEYSVDVESMIEDNPKAFGLDGDYSDYDVSDLAYDIEDKFSVEPDKDEKLSNGDTVTFSWKKTKTESLEKIFPIKIKAADNKIEVYDLDEAEEFDPFEKVSVLFEGTAPNGKAKLDASGVLSGLSYTIDNYEKLKNGDKVTVKVTDSYGKDPSEMLLSEYGKIPTSLEKKYTVEGLTSYAAKLDDIPKETLEKICAQTEDSVRSDSTGWHKSFKLDNMEFVGYYFLYAKDGFEPEVFNSVICVYKVNTTVNIDDKDNKDSYYTFGKCDNITILPDGVCSVDLSSIRLANHRTDSIKKNYEYKGYSDLDSMFNDVITSASSDHTYESTVK